jgi:hypothetical protein
VPDALGHFEADVSGTGPFVWEVSSFGRAVKRGDVPADGAIGDIDIAMPATLQVTIENGATPWYGQVVLVPADQATMDDVRGTFHGRYDECAPWLGPPHGGSPACNRFLVDPTGGEAEVPAGTYDVYATSGPEFSLGHADGVVLAAGEVTTLDFSLAGPPALSGWLTADLHVHGRASFDSSFPDRDRVLTFVASGVQVIAATDHDFVVDYADTVTQLGVGDQVKVLGGVETTQLIPWMKFPDEAFPKVIGHFNFWPIEPQAGVARGGEPWDELIEPGQLFDRMDPLIGEGGMRMLNHPWDDPQSGRDLGYLRAIKFDPRLPIPDASDGTRNGILQRRPGGGHKNMDWNVVEVGNGAGPKQYVKSRVLWWSLLSQGFLAAGAANSDSHGMSDAHLGWGRNYVQTTTTLADFDPDLFDDAVEGGRMSGGSGIFVNAYVRNSGGGPILHGEGFDPFTPAQGDQIVVEVWAPAWIPVTELRAVTSQGVSVIADGIAAPADPYGGWMQRYTGTFEIDDLIGAGDDWVAFEAGIPLPPYEDLDDDGVPDTGDNNLDGVVDVHDVEEGEDSGPIADPPDPAFDDKTDARYLMTRAIPSAYPIGFTNPILIDRAGDGWDPPGLP